MKLMAIVAGAATFLYASGAWAAPNLLSNGSFENGLSDWTIGGTAADNLLPAAIYYNSNASYPNGAQGEPVKPDDAVSDSPDSAGSRAAYFVSDYADNLSLTQTVYLKAGTYRVGFDAYAPLNGYNEQYDASFSAEIAGVTLADYKISSGPSQSWQDFSGLATIEHAGNYTASFVFNTGIFPAKDVVIDKVFITGDSGIGVPIGAVPEPANWAMMIGGLGFIGAAIRRRYRLSEAVFTNEVRRLAQSAG